MRRSSAASRTRRPCVSRIGSTTRGVSAPDPDIVVRIYHDARLVEAVSSGEAHRHTKLRELAESSNAELDRRWRLNMLLNKWLDYLFEVGHSLGAAERALS